MNKFFAAFFLMNLLIVNLLKAQDLKLFQENKDKGYIIYANNNEFYPVSISIDFELTNLAFSETQKKIFVIPPKSERYKIGELSLSNKSASKYKFAYRYEYTIGDVTITNYDKSFEYDLPFQKGQSYIVSQGYNGAFSHKDNNSIDFNMPEGSPILVAREGIVVQIVQNNSQSCPREECNKYNNHILVMHSDGTFASYAHIKKNSVKLNVGDKVKKGDVIAISGNTGWTNGPHLHFSCFIGSFKKAKTLKTLFRINHGKESVFLKEGNTYFRNY